MLRVLALLLLVLVLFQTSGILLAFEQDGCAAGCPGEGAGGNCPPDCVWCACCPSVRPIVAERIILGNELEPCGATLQEASPIISSPRPTDISHVPRFVA